MIEAEQALWDNLIISFPKIKKFRTKGFPHFDALGELYDGQMAEGTYNFTSTERSKQPSKQPVVPHVEIDPEVMSVEVIMGDATGQGDPNNSHIGETSVDTHDDTQGGMQQANLQANNAGHDETPQAVAAAPSTNTDKEPKRRRTNGDVASMMEKYIEMKTRQIEAVKADSRNVDDYSIKNCIARLNTMGVSQEEKVKAMRVFKDADNRQLFICAEPEIALMWLRAEMA